MLTYIFNKISGKVTIDITPELIVFTRRGRSISIPTFLYLYDDNGTYKILGIGEDFEGSSSCLRVELFKGEPPSGEFFSRVVLL